MAEQAPGLMCVHAHPDDEVIMTGGVLARAVSEGIRARVVTCTGGEMGEVVGEGMDPDEIFPKLAEVRLEELREALAVLGTDGPQMLGYRDSGMMGTDGNADPRSFWQADMDEAVGKLVRQIRDFRPTVLVSYDAFGGYGHPDHIQAHRVMFLASEAAAVPMLYPDAGPAWSVRKVYFSTLPKSRIFLVNQLMEAQGLASPFPTAERAEDLPMGTPDGEVTTQIDVSPWLDQKMRALRAHRSQLSPDSFFLNVPADLEAQAFGTEWFVRMRSRVAAPDREDDLFAGLR